MRSLHLATLLASAVPDLFKFDVSAAPAVSLAGISAADRDALLARAVKREHVELDLSILSYEQRPGTRNRKSVRFSDKALAPMAKSAVGRPFIRDHLQGDSTARSGTIKSSEAKSTAGRAEIWMGVTLADPAAVERALRGLMGSVSIGTRPTGPINCTICNSEILSTRACLEGFHLPGTETDDGVVEWEYTAAEIVELSECSVPAVPAAGIASIHESLRATLSSTGLMEFATSRAPAVDPDHWRRPRRRVSSF